MANINDENKVTCHAPDEQIAYADILFWGAWISILIMLVTYTLYVTGIMEPYIPLNEITKYWSKPVHEYVEVAHAPTGWKWVSFLGKGDFLNFIGIAILAAMTVFCFLITYAGIVITEIVVLTVAASGILGSGGH